MRHGWMLVTAALLAACAGSDQAGGDAAATDSIVDGPWGPEGSVAYPSDPGEPRLANLRKLTHGGENAEAYFSADGRQLIFQATREGVSACDQMFVMDTDGRNVHRVSNGDGRTTCGYFYPAGDHILYSSTHLVDAACPAPPDYSRGYVWGLFPFDIFIANPDGTDLRQLTHEPGYDAEATISTDGSRIVFTSDRSGDLEIYVMNADGSDVRRLTHEVGYDGGPFFSPDGERVIFASNMDDPQGRNFDLYLIRLDGTGLERVTRNPTFDGFPMFSPDGTRLVFASNRGARQEGFTNVFIADWVEDLPKDEGR